MEAMERIAIFQANWPLPMRLSVIYWFCVFWGYTYQYFMPLFLFYFICRHVSVLDDAIGLRKEVKVIAIIYCILNLAPIIQFVTMRLIPMICPDLLNYWPIIFLMQELLKRISYFAINYMQTRWVVAKLTHLTFRSRNPSSGDVRSSSAIGLRSALYLPRKSASHWQLGRV